MTALFKSWQVALNGTSVSEPALRSATCLLRNAIAHGRFSFSSDSRLLEEVTIVFEDWKPNATAAHWRASIRADKLRMFCHEFITLVIRADQEEVE